MSKRRRIVIPHEHGGWAMVSVPYLFGMAVGSPQWMHIPLFLAWLFLYLSSYPLLQAVKRAGGRSYWLKWRAVYGLIGIVCLVFPLLHTPDLIYFGIPLLVLLSINVWHVKAKSERAIANDLCAILIFAIGGAAAYLLGGGGWDGTMAAIVGFNFMYFAGSAFFVKTIFRERGNKRWITYARVYHAAVLIVPWLFGAPWMSLPFVYPAVRAFVFSGKALRSWKAGVIEIVGALQFLLLSIWLM